MVSHVVRLEKHALSVFSCTLLRNATLHAQVVELMRKSSVIGDRKNIALHVVFKDSEFYPVNYLRNVALDTVETEYVLSLDVDFVTADNLHDSLVSTLANLRKAQEVSC